MGQIETHRVKNTNISQQVLQSIDWNGFQYKLILYGKKKKTQKDIIFMRLHPCCERFAVNSGTHSGLCAILASSHSLFIFSFFTKMVVGHKWSSGSAIPFFFYTGEFSHGHCCTLLAQATQFVLSFFLWLCKTLKKRRSMLFSAVKIDWFILDEVA